MAFKLFKKKTAACLPFFFAFLSPVLLADSLKIINGEWQQGALIRGQVDKKATLVFNGKQLSLGKNGEFVFGLGRDTNTDVVLELTEEGRSHRHIFPVKKRQYDVQSVTGVPQATVEPNPEQDARIKAEAVKVSAARKRSIESLHFMEAFQWPVLGPISGVYGSQRIYNGIPKAPHYGVDIAMPVGTEVHAPAGGIVTLAEEDLFLSGGTLIIDHGLGVSSTFLHLSKVIAKKNQLIKQGDLIGLVGKTGRASGPHLHWAMNWFDERVDPQLLVPPMPKSSSN